MASLYPCPTFGLDSGNARSIRPEKVHLLTFNVIKNADVNTSNIPEEKVLWLQCSIKIFSIFKLLFWTRIPRDSNLLVVSGFMMKKDSEPGCLTKVKNCTKNLMLSEESNNFFYWAPFGSSKIRNRQNPNTIRTDDVHPGLSVILAYPKRRPSVTATSAPAPAA
jgi:hypothetical protein